MTSEKTVLAECLYGDAIQEVSRILTPEDFTDPNRQTIYAAMLSLFRSNLPVDPSTVMAELKRNLPALVSLSDLGQGSIKRGSVEYHLHEIRAAADKRKLTRLLREMSESERPAAQLAQELYEMSGEFRQAVTGNSDFLVSGARFCSTVPDQIEWLVDGIIPLGGNGIISGEPKASKSFTADELILCLASGTPFLNCNVRRPVRCALVAREDYPGLTSWRLKALFNSRRWENPNFFDENLYVNTRAQSDQFSIENPIHRQQAIEAFKKHRIKFAVFDVLNILHGADENDNSEMRKVMNLFTEIQTEAKCSIALIHHLGKGEGKWTKRLRGASSIHGWVEFLLGISLEDEQTGLRKIEFEIKAGRPHEPMYYQIESEEGKCEAYLKQHFPTMRETSRSPRLI